jgi:hypothetical protein
MESRMKKYEVWLKSVPGMYAQYSGKVDVYASDEEDAVERAFDKLRRGAFSDRSRSMWRVTEVKCVEWGAA